MTTPSLSGQKQPSTARLDIILFAICVCALVGMLVMGERQVRADRDAITAEARVCEESGGTVLYRDQQGKRPMFARDGSVACMRD